MHRVSYEMLINGVEDDSTRLLIGEIDVEIIKENNIYSLCYEFPLIERIVLEIYKLLPMSDIEYYQQGTMRTIIEIINNDVNHYFPDYLIALLRKYYGEKGIRNKFLHIDNPSKLIKIKKREMEELKYIIMQLISILKETYKKVSNNKIRKIELIR